MYLTGNINIINYKYKSRMHFHMASDNINLKYKQWVCNADNTITQITLNQNRECGAQPTLKHYFINTSTTLTIKFPLNLVKFKILKQL